MYLQGTSFKYPGMSIYKDCICFTLERLMIITLAQLNEFILYVLAYLFHGCPPKYTRIIQLAALLFNYALKKSVTN